MTGSRPIEPLRTDLAERVFRIGEPVLEDRIGLEVEYLLRHEESGLPVHLEGSGGAREAVAELADRLAWGRVPGESGAPGWEAPCGCAVTFEPGGQVEVASPPAPSLPAVVGCMAEVTLPLRQHFSGRGWHMPSVAIDPHHDAEEIDLELGTPRYRRMAEHFSRLGPAGRRMMRQTTSMHINVDLGIRPFARWYVANALAPILTAVFANSSVYNGEASGYRSFRSWQWQTLDPSRTGTPGTGTAPVDEYLRFALAAPAILAGAERRDAEPFQIWWDRTGDLELWRQHLSTLFPEVRPRGYLEVRSVDLLPDRWLPVPAAFVVGVLYSDRALAEAHRVLPFPTDATYRTAARYGLRDPELKSRAAAAWKLALQGMTELRHAVSPEQVELARAFEAAFTRQGLDPASSYERDFDPAESHT